MKRYRKKLLVQNAELLQIKVIWQDGITLVIKRIKITKRLEELFNFPAEQSSQAEPATITVDETRAQLANLDATIDKIDAALPTVRDLETGDQELDDLAAKAQETFDNLMDLGFNVDSRFSSEIFAVAGTMLGHALTAKTAKLNKKLKMVDLQLKKLKMDQDQRRNEPEPTVETAHGQVLNRNDLLERLINSRDQKDNKA